MIILIGYGVRFIASFFLWIAIYSIACLLASERFSFKNFDRVDYLLVFLTAVIQLYQLPEIVESVNLGIASVSMCILFLIFLKRKLNRSILWNMGIMTLSNLISFPVQIFNVWWITYLGWDFGASITVFYYPFQLAFVILLYQFLLNSYQSRLLVIIQNIYSRFYMILGGIFIATMAYFVYCSPQFSNAQSRVDFDADALIWTALLSVPVFIAIIGYVDYQNKQLKAQSEYLKAYSISLEMLYHEMRAYRHDIDNILLSIKLMIEDGKLDDLKCYFEDKIENLSGIDIDLYNLMMRLEMIGDHAVKSLLLSKLKQAESQELNIEIHIDELTEFKDVADIDLCRIFGILLDNAIEAASGTEERALGIIIKHHERSIDVTISNSIIGELNSIHKVCNKDRGIGLKSLNAILRRYEHIKHRTFVSDNGYEQVISFNKV